MKAKKYLWSIICVYFCYLTHGIQAIILSQNNVNFAKQWGFNMSDPQSAAYAAGTCSSKYSSCMDRISVNSSVCGSVERSLTASGRKKLMIGGAIIIYHLLPWILIYKQCSSCFYLRICCRSCNIRILGCIRISGCTGSLSGSTWFCADRNQILRFIVWYGVSAPGCT